MRVIQYMFAASLCNTPFDKNKKRFLSILVSCFVCSRILNIAWLKPMQTGWKHENIPYKQIFHYMFVLRSFPHLFTFTPSFFFCLKKFSPKCVFDLWNSSYCAKHKAKLKHDADIKILSARVQCKPSIVCDKK